MSEDPIKVVLLDRDGVLNVDLPTGVTRIEDLRLIDGAAEAVARLCAMGFRCVVISNQSVIGKGLCDVAMVEAINGELAKALSAAGGSLSACYYCPDHPDRPGPRRKPAPGMLLEAQAAFGFDPAETWFVGDAVRDAEAAEAAGCRPAFVRTGKGAREAPRRPEIPCFADLLAFADYLLT